MRQAETVSKLIEPKVGPVEIVRVKTSGDRGQRDQLGAFVKELQEQLLDAKIDGALHCLKDLPTKRVENLTLAAYLPREDPRDALLSPHGLAALPSGAVIGTGSLRRTAQMSALRPDFAYKPLVGNIDTRMRKLMAGEYDAIVLAMAGLQRLGLTDTWRDSEYAGIRMEPLEADIMLPAPGQAVLVIECADGPWAGPLSAMDHAPSRACALAERSFLSKFGTGCSLPVGAIAISAQGGYELTGGVFGPNGVGSLRETAFGSDPAALGSRLAQTLIERGALKLLPESTARLGGGQH